MANTEVEIELDENRSYHRVERPSRDGQVDRVENILSKAVYPKRLVAGLDDLTMEELRFHLEECRPLNVGLRLTNVCNYDCIYCGTAANRGKDNDKSMSFDEYKAVIEQAAEVGARTIIFGANGEPLLTDRILELLECTAAAKMTPLIFSNISIIGNDRLCMRKHGVDGIEFLRRLDEAGTTLIISTESLQRESYDHIMGVKSFDSFELAVKRIREHSTLTRKQTMNGHPLCRIVLSAVVMPINYDERFELVEFAHSLNGAAVLKPPSLHGSAAVNKDQMYTVVEAMRIRPEIQELSDKQATLQVLTLACASWTLGFSIDNEGNFMSCMTEEVNPFGDKANIRNTRLADVLSRRNELVKLGTSICPVKDKFYVRS